MRISRVWAATLSLICVVFTSSVDVESLGAGAQLGAAMKVVAGLAPAAFLLLYFSQGQVAAAGLNRSIYPLAIFFAWAAISVLWTISLDATLTALAAWASALCCVLLLLGLSFAKAMQCIAVTAGTVCGLSLVFAAVSPSAFVEHQGVARLQGLLYGPHALAQPAVIGLCIFASGVVPLRKFVVRSLFGITAIAIVLTFSRQAMAAALAGVAVSIFFRSSKSRRAQFLLLGPLLAALAVMLYLAANEDIATFVSRGEADDVMSLTGRTFIWAAAVDLIQGELIKGFGFGAGGIALQQSYSSVFGWTTYNAHNALLQIALDLGIPGLILGVVLIWRLLKQAFSLERSVAVAVVASILIVSSVERGFYAVGGFVPAVFLYVLLFRRSELGRQAHSEWSGSRARNF